MTHDQNTVPLTKTNGASFQDWCKALDAHHEALRQSGEIVGYGEGSIVALTGADCWVDYFDDGYSPEDALSEDRSYWWD